MLPENSLSFFFTKKSVEAAKVTGVWLPNVATCDTVAPVHGGPAVAPLEC
jgi:hypothetical protein